MALLQGSWLLGLVSSYEMLRGVGVSQERNLLGIFLSPGGFVVLQRIFDFECFWMPAQKIDGVASLVALAREIFELLLILRISYQLICADLGIFENEKCYFGNVSMVLLLWIASDCIVKLDA